MVENAQRRPASIALRPIVMGLAILTYIGLTGCQTDTTGFKSNSGAVLSLEEAKKVTAEFKTTSYVQPERTIDDIRRLLGEPHTERSNCEDIRAKRKSDLITLLQNAGTEENLSASLMMARPAIEMITRQFQRGRFKQTIEWLDAAIFNLEDPSPGTSYDRFIATRPLYNLQLARLMALIGNKERSVEILHSAEADLTSISADEIVNIHNSLNFQSTSNILLPLIRAFKAKYEGHIKRSEEYFREAFRNRYFMPWGLRLVPFSRLHSFIAENLLRQGRVVEAEHEVRKAWLSERGPNLRKSDDELYTANLALPTRQLAEIYLLQGRLDNAHYLARMAVNMYEYDCSSPDSVGLALARRTLAQTQAATGNWKSIIVQFDYMRDTLVDSPGYFERLYGDNLEWALALAKTGSAKKAIERLRKTLEKFASRDNADNYNNAEIRGILARAELASGQLEDALKNFSEAVPVLLDQQENQRAGVHKRIQDFRLRLILDGYIETLLQIHENPLAEQQRKILVSKLFRISNVAHLGRVQRALSASSARNAIKDSILKDLMRREQDAVQEMESTLKILSTLELAPPGQVNPKTIIRLRSRFSKLAKARRVINREVSRQYPAYANLINPGPASLEQAVSALRPDEALLMFYVGDAETLVWAVPWSGEVSFARIPLSQKQLADRIASLRLSLDPKVTTLGEIPPFDIELAHATFKSLLEPVKAGWEDAKKLLVVPHGALGQLPFGLLVTDRFDLPQQRPGSKLFSNYRNVPWLIKRVSIARYPSVNALVTLRGSSMTAQSQLPLAAFADPYFSSEQMSGAVSGTKRQLASRNNTLQARNAKFQRRSAPDTRQLASAKLSTLPRLPDTADEAKGIARALNADVASSVFTGVRANEDIVKTMDLSGRRVIVFATHGLLPGDLDGLTQPALALTAPTIANVDGDGLLTMSEILGLKLNAEWVVLSACNTGAGEGAGAEAVSGLGRAFFYAGARALLVSNWPVETTSAATLTTTLFQIQEGASKPSRDEALRQAMLKLIDSGYSSGIQGQIHFSYAHPIFWAPFTLIGDGERTAPIN